MWMIPTLAGDSSKRASSLKRIGQRMDVRGLARRCGYAFEKVTHYWREEGFRAVAGRLVRRFERQIRQASPARNYRAWQKAFEPSALELQRQMIWSQQADGPLLSLCTDLPADLPAKNLKRYLALTAESLTQQTYGIWEWIVVTDRPSADMSELLEVESRIRVVSKDQADWFTTSQGSHVARLNLGDRLSPWALFAVADRLDENASIDVLYGDHDIWTPTGRRCQPQMLPEWSPENLLEANDLGNTVFFRRELLRSLEESPQSTWDALLQTAEHSCQIEHIPQVLFHRCPETEGAEDGETLLPKTFLRRGLNWHCERQLNRRLRLTWPVDTSKTVSIVIPTKDRYSLISKCLDGLLHHTAYPSLEIILVDNGSTDVEVLALYESLKHDARVRVVEFDQPFNYSVACNIGARAANGDYLLFLNNDIEVIDPEWLTELVRWGEQAEIGVVGARLLFPSGKIQHAGLALGLTSVAGHLFANLPPGTPSPLGNSESLRNVTAVTGACQLLRTELFWDVGGMDEEFRMTYSDVTLCLKIWQQGYRNLYTPHATLVHHESATRPLGDSLEDLELFVEFLVNRGIDRDPYFHPALECLATTPRLRRADEQNTSEQLASWIERLRPRTELKRAA